MIATIAGPGVVIAPRSTRVAQSTMIPAFCIPINAMKKPMPTLIAFLRLSGILLTIASLILKIVNTIKIRPSILMQIQK